MDGSGKPCLIISESLTYRSCNLNSMVGVVEYNAGCDLHDPGSIRERCRSTAPIESISSSGAVAAVRHRLSGRPVTYQQDLLEAAAELPDHGAHVRHQIDDPQRAQTADDQQQLLPGDGRHRGGHPHQEHQRHLAAGNTNTACSH